MTQTNYMLPVVEQRVVTQISRSFNGLSNYEKRIFSDMKKKNPELEKAISGRIQSHSRYFDAEVVEVIACLTYDHLNRQAKRQGTKLPKVSQDTVLKYNQQLRNEKDLVMHSYELIRDENLLLINQMVEGLRKGTANPDVRKSCLMTVLYIHDVLVNQAKEDKLSKLEWIVE